MRRVVFGVILLFWAANAGGDIVTTTYQFEPSQSSLLTGGGFVGAPPSYYATIEGNFKLSIDFAQSIAYFENVNATLSKIIDFADYPGTPVFTNNLNTMFHLTEMVSTNVSENLINFRFRKYIPNYPGADVILTLTLFENTINIEGGFREDFIADGRSFNINAVVTVIPEPSSVIILALGALLLRKKI